MTSSGERLVKVTKSEAEFIVPPPHSIYRGFLDPGTHASLLAWVMDNEAKFETSLVGCEDDAKYDPSRRISLRASDFGPMMAVVGQCVLDFVPTLIADLRITPFEPCGSS